MTTGAPSPYHIRTYSGRFINPLAPDPDSIELQDIVHALAHLCRFTGHTDVFYSVAEHSVCVSQQVARSLEQQGLPAPVVRAGAFLGLMHDAPEAYLGDIARPLKHNSAAVRRGRLQRAEKQLLELILLRFGWVVEITTAQAAAILEALECADSETVFAWEYHLFMGGEQPLCSLARMPVGLASADARKLFLDEFSRLTQGNL